MALKDTPDDIREVGHRCYNHSAPIEAEKGMAKRLTEQLTVAFPHHFPAGADLRDPKYRHRLEMVRDLFHVDIEGLIPT